MFTKEEKELLTAVNGRLSRVNMTVGNSFTVHVDTPASTGTGPALPREVGVLVLCITLYFVVPQLERGGFC